MMCVVFVKNKRNTKTEQTFEPSPLSCPAADPYPGLSHPGTGTPGLSHPATVPSQMPLRGPESQSERFLDVSQYETLERPSEALRMAYSA